MAPTRASKKENPTLTAASRGHHASRVTKPTYRPPHTSNTPGKPPHDQRHGSRAHTNTGNKPRRSQHADRRSKNTFRYATHYKRSLEMTQPTPSKYNALPLELKEMIMLNAVNAALEEAMILRPQFYNYLEVFADLSAFRHTIAIRPFRNGLARLHGAFSSNKDGRAALTRALRTTKKAIEADDTSLCGLKEAVKVCQYDVTQCIGPTGVYLYTGGGRYIADWKNLLLSAVEDVLAALGSEKALWFRTWRGGGLKVIS